MKYHPQLIFVKIKQKAFPQNALHFRKIFGEFSVKRTVGGSENDRTTKKVPFVSSSYNGVAHLINLSLRFNIHFWIPLLVVLRGG